MGNHRADVTSDSPRSVTPSPGATTSSSYVGKRRAAPAPDSPASRPAPRATGSTSYVGKRRAAPAPTVGTTTPSLAPETPEEPVAKARLNRVVLDQTGKLPVVGSPRDEAPLDKDGTDSRISTGELRALVEGDGGHTFPASFPTTPAPAKSAPQPMVPVQRRAAQIDPVLADLLGSMGIDPDKVTPEVLDDLGVGGMTTSELTMFLTQPTKPAPMRAAASKPVSTKTPPRGVPAAPALPEPVAPVAAPAPVAPVAPVAPEPTFQAPEPTHTPKPLRMANTFAPLTGKIRAVRHARPIPAPPVIPPTPAYEPEAQEPRGFQEAFDAPPTSFKIDTTSFPAPPVSLPQQIDFDSMAIDLPAETYTVDAPYFEEPQADEAFYEDDYADSYGRDPQHAETYFRADLSTGSGPHTGSIDLPSISEIATYRPELHEFPAVETTGTMVGIGGPTRPRTRRAAAAAAGGRPTVPLTAGAAALAAAIGGVALTGGPTMVAADDVRLVGATALGGDSDMVVVGDRSATVTRNDERSEADTAASDREKALQGVDVQADKQDKFLKSNLWELPIPAGVYRITGTFGSSGSNWASTHTGLDFAAPYGTPIHAIARGTVTETGWGGAYGNRTIITLEDGTEIWYCHQSDFGVSVGQTVSPGEVIGYVGSTGNSTGNHLHVEVRPGGGDAVDPDAALNEHSS